MLTNIDIVLFKCVWVLCRLSLLTKWVLIWKTIHKLYDVRCGVMVGLQCVIVLFPGLTHNI